MDLNIISIGQAAGGPRKLFNKKRGPQATKFGNRWSIWWTFNIL